MFYYDFYLSLNQNIKKVILVSYFHLVYSIYILRVAIMFYVFIK